MILTLRSRNQGQTKLAQEFLKQIKDSGKKIVIVGNDIAEYTDNKGIRFMGLFQFLLTGLAYR